MPSSETRDQDPRPDKKESIILCWEKQCKESLELYGLATIAPAMPDARDTVKRKFLALKFILCHNA